MARTVDDPQADQQIAIIGMACRLPGAATVDEFWTNLLGGVESLSTFTDQQLLDAGVSPEVLRSPHYVRSRGIIGGADRFDAAFFGFTPRDAELLDPQHRIFLECAWHALEDGGYLPGQTDARIAVFGGVGTNWHLTDVSRHPDAKKFASAASMVTSNDKDYLTTRVSYKLDLTGPSVNVQCACSTSLVAAILGMNSLRSYHCDLVLAGGATIEIPETKGYLYQEGGMESPDGRCRPFDARANGTVFSRGAGVVLLKRLSEAVRDRDHIYAVILDGAINNDGSLKTGFTAPSVNGQVEVAVEALERAGVSADSLSFVEAHGTATALGDPIEVASLTQVFQHYTNRRQFCALGSVKGNIGHTDVASGLAGLIKTALALESRTLPASLNFETPNPKIDFPNSPFFVNTARQALSRGATPLRALVNAFGVGGTNACLILEEPPVATVSAHGTGPTRETGVTGEAGLTGESGLTGETGQTAELAVNGQANGQTGRRENVLLLSAKTEAALEAATAAMRQHVEAHPSLSLNDLAYTAQVGRRPFTYRRAVAFSGRDDLLARLWPRANGGTNPVVCPADGRPVVFAFPGQGNQYVGMGRGLYAGEPVFRAAVDACCDLLRPMLDVDLREVMFATGAAASAAAQRLNQTYLTQPALFVTSYAQARLWMAWGLTPEAMIGHSVGEYVAACLAGVFSMEDALTAVARRGQLIQALPRGSMLAVLLPEDEVLPYLSPALAVAAVNGPQLTVVAGPTPEIADLEARLASGGASGNGAGHAGHKGGRRIVCKRLDTSHAFHSSMMDPALPEFGRVLASVSLAAPSVPIASTVTGTWLTREDATSVDYWVQHMRRPVRLLDALKTLVGAEQPYILLESGPGHSIASAAKHVLDPNGPHRVVGSMRADSDPGSDMDYLMGAVGALWTAGRPIDWTSFYGAPHTHSDTHSDTHSVTHAHSDTQRHTHGDARPRRITMPGYPFERQKFALDFSKDTASASRDAKKEDNRKKPDVGDWFYVPCWKRTPTADFARVMPVGRTPAARHIAEHSVAEHPGAEQPVAEHSGADHPDALHPDAERQDLARPDGERGRVDRHCWIVFEDRVGLAAAIRRQLDAAGDEVIAVQPGESFRRVDTQTFTVRVGVKRDYEDLIGLLKDEGRKPTRVLHLWNVDAEDAPLALDRHRQDEARAFYSPLFTEQAFIKHTLLDDLRLIVVANGAFDVAGEGVPSPAKALATGPCRVIGKEFPMVRARFVDVDLAIAGGTRTSGARASDLRAGDPRSADALARHLIGEAHLDTTDTVAAYRRGYRWTESFELAYLDAPAPHPQHADAPTLDAQSSSPNPSTQAGARAWVRDDGVYLITGGLGGLGLFFARQIARAAARTSLVLTQRSALPDRTEWQRWLAEHGDQESTSQRIKGVLDLEEAGARVMLAQADSADLDTMQEVVREAERRFGRITGVIHAAGMAGGGIISLKTDEMAAEVLEPKVRGTLVLDHLFRDAELDFLLLFSSITSVLGEAGRVDYCAANAFMDAVAQHYRSARADRPSRVWSIDWGSWGEFGMAARWQETKAQRKGARARARRADDGRRLQLVSAEARPGGEHEIYDVLLDPEQDWVINSHQVFGVPSLVGTTFLELVHQFAELKEPGRAPVLEQLSFVSPLMFEPGKEKKVRLYVESADGTYRFSFRSQLVERGEGKDVWHRHFMGALRTIARVETPRVDVAALRARFDGDVDTGPFYERPDGPDTPFLSVGERWSIRKELRLGEGEWLARIELQDRYVPDLQEHPYHPAITDVALAAAVQQVARAAYLPSGYARIAFQAPYPSMVWSHIRLHGTFEPGAETLSFDITILDAEGRELASIEQYTLKKVTATKAAPTPERTLAAGDAAQAGRTPGAAGDRLLGDPKDILPDEGLSALARILHAPFLPQVIVCTSDLHKLIEDEEPASKSAAKDEPTEAAAKPVAAYARPSLSTPYEAPANEVEKAIGDIWSGILGIDPIGVNDDFTELGGNSLLAVQTVANIADAFGVDLPVEAFTRRPTVRGQAETVVELLVAMASEETLEDLVSNLEAR